MTEVQLRALLLVHGQVAFYERPIDQHTQRPGAVVYVEMAPAAAVAAIKALNGHRLGDASLTVNAARPPAAWAPAADRGPRSPVPRRIVTAASSRDAAKDSTLPA